MIAGESRGYSVCPHAGHLFARSVRELPHLFTAYPAKPGRAVKTDDLDGEPGKGKFFLRYDSRQFTDTGIFHTSGQQVRTGYFRSIHRFAAEVPKILAADHSAA